MTDAYDGNGDYGNYNDDEKDYPPQRKSGTHNGGGGGGGGSGGVQVGDHHGGGGGDGIQLNDKANEYIRDCLTEKTRMDRKFPIAEKLLECEIEKVQSTGRIPSREQKYADIYREKPLRVSQKVLVPIREHPKFNFVGKLLGPKGNSLRRLQEETLCKMTVLGRNSMRDRVKEEELRSSKDPKYAHLNNDLHVEISTIAPPAEAYARIAYAMAELRKYLIPDSNDDIRQEQLRELMDHTSISDNTIDGGNKMILKKGPHHNVLGGGGGGGGGGGSGGNGGGGGGGGGNINTGQGINNMNTGTNIPNKNQHNYRPSQQAPPPPPPQMYAKNAMGPKQKVLSILEKARTAMDETYGRGYDEHVSYESQQYDNYSYGHGGGGGGAAHSHNTHGGIQQQSGGISGGGMTTRAYDNTEYEHEYPRRDYYQHSPNYGAGGGGGSGQSNQNIGLNQNHNRSHVNR